MAACQAHRQNHIQLLVMAVAYQRDAAVPLIE